MKEEIWKPIVGYENIYEVSNHGRVRTLDGTYISRRKGKIVYKPQKGCIRTLQKGKDGYMHVALNKGGKVKLWLVHRLVAIAFLENPDNKKCVDHIDTERTNNFVDNLRWVTHSENSNNSISRMRGSISHKKKYQEEPEKFVKFNRKGCTHTEQAKKRMSLSHKGKPLTEKQREGLQEIWKLLAEKNKKRIIQLSPDFETIKIWDSIKEAATYYGVTSKAIINSAKSDNRKSCGYFWRYE